MADGHSIKDLLEALSLQAAGSAAQKSAGHGSRLAKLPVNSWQVDVLRNADGVASVETPADMRKAMGDYQVAVIFLPQAAMVTAEVIERICLESGLDKLIVWETDE